VLTPADQERVLQTKSAMIAVPKRALNRSGALLTAGFACLVSSGIYAAEIPGSALLLAGDSIGLAHSHPESPPYPMVLDHNAGLDFDLAGSETRKLQLVLGKPLSLQGGLETRVSSSGADLLGLGVALDLPISSQLSVGADVGRQLGHSRFQPLGSIQCLNGTLRADSYTASGCRFVNEPLATHSQEQVNLGARLDLNAASASVNWFTRAAAVNQPVTTRAGIPAGQAMMNNGLLSPNLGNPLLSTATNDPLQYLNSEASGVDLNFKVGVTTDTRGDLQLGLAFSRVLDADFHGLYSQDASAFSWTLAEPFNSARMNLEWSSGAFSTGIQGYYRDSVDFLNRNSIDSITTFDVHFTWRTPWNANLSVGATNVLNAGSDAAGSSENQPVDPLESIYGRIPYVRYKQDL
jgi:hypothetical protein